MYSVSCALVYFNSYIGYASHLFFFIVDTMCLLPLSSRTLECEFCGYPVNNETIHVFRPRSSDASEDKGWIEWILDDGTSTCHAFGGEEV